MSAVPEKVLNWLYSVLTSEYSHVQRTYNDAAEVLSRNDHGNPFHLWLQLGTEDDSLTYVQPAYENGASALLLLLSGTLPVTFRGATYGFPMAIWVPYGYPREAPMVYMTPSQDMVVRPGQHVGGDGRVYHPYLAQWAQYWDVSWNHSFDSLPDSVTNPPTDQPYTQKSTLFDLLAVLRGVFAKEPPVRSKQPIVHSPSPVIPPPPPPKPPKPGDQDQNRATPQPSHHRYSQPPPLPPPRPPLSPSPQHPHAQSSQQQQQQQPYQLQRNSYGYNPQSSQGNPDISPPTPIPSRQPRPQAQAQAQSYATAQPSYDMPSPVSPVTPDGSWSISRYSHTGPPQSHQHALQSQQYQGPPPPQSHPFSAPHTGPQQQYPQQPPHGYPPQSHLQYPHQQQPQQQLRPPHQATPAAKPPVNLLDDSLQVTLPSQSNNHLPVPVPPVPPNPEKDALLRALSQTLVAQIRQTVSSNQSAIGPLQAQQQALQTAHARLQAELGELQQLDSALASNEQVLKGAMVEADRVMEDARRRQAPDVDDVLVAPTLVGGQLYTLAAEEKGIADALFILGRALDKGRVGAEVFAKQTRSLAREQFLKKALIKKIARGMALDEYQMR
ncbi:hypothetical protein LEMA_P078020.1 [Plenodomus lingam JN3]|uniref:UEV domain-containing protein n=1 Tax=Leptosphaeria maculans (strain JN3 / isolate v23.1.3 / race Av1-4-5-6-7-8) TaxID=985895 RepID=E5A4L5_LEPMJ|nr:hypothetical protein LEMA_P078020.1 [Plenodomus lingam JN3]CBX98563.1 hypothetical protein LEMA_P078020.1 [Plenodomus lingam JN3]